MMVRTCNMVGEENVIDGEKGARQKYQEWKMANVM